MSHNSVGLQGLYQGSLYFFSFFYSAFTACNSPALFVWLCEQICFSLFVCLFLVVLFSAKCVIVCMRCVQVLCMWLVHLCYIVIVIPPPDKEGSRVCCGCRDQHFLYLGASWIWVMSFTPPALPHYSLDGTLCAPKSRWDLYVEVNIVYSTGTRTRNPQASNP
jgi:hypothetical protein